MNIKTYNFVTLTPPLIFLSIIFVMQNEWLAGFFVLPESASFFLLLFKSVTALFTLLSGIYFFQANIIKSKNITNPIWSIFMGVLFIIMSYGSTFFAYKMIPSFSETTIKAEHIENFKSIAIDKNRYIEDRKICAKMIYTDTGAKVKILGREEKIVFFEPSDTEIRKRQTIIETYQSHQNLLTFIKKALIYQIFLLLVSLCGFVLLLKKFPPKLLIIKDS